MTQKPQKPKPIHIQSAAILAAYTLTEEQAKFLRSDGFDTAYPGRVGITVDMALALAKRAGVKVSRGTVYNHVAHPRRLPMVDFLVTGLGVNPAGLFALDEQK